MDATAGEQRVELLARDLESGEFSPAKGRLRTADGYCCLGVACERYHRETGQGHWLHDPETGYWSFVTEATDSRGHGSLLPPDVALWYGFTFRHQEGRPPVAESNPYLPLLGDAAAGANDTGSSFTEIAAGFRDGWGPGSKERYPG